MSIQSILAEHNVRLLNEGTFGTNETIKDLLISLIRSLAEELSENELGITIRPIDSDGYPLGQLDIHIDSLLLGFVSRDPVPETNTMVLTSRTEYAATVILNGIAQFTSSFSQFALVDNSPEQG